MAAARGILDDAVALSKRADSSWYSAYPPLWQARHALITGDWAAASASIQEALDLAAQADNRHALRWAAPVMAELDILDGRAEAARARLVPLLDQSGRQGYDVTLLLPMLAWAQLELGEVEQAAQTVEQALERARPEEMRLVLVEALRVLALIALRRSQYAAAAHAVEEGLALAQAMPYPYAEARLLSVAGLLQAARGAPEEARQRWEEALICFTRLGARADMARTAQSLEALPRVPVAATATEGARRGAVPPATVVAVTEGRHLARADRQSWVLQRLRTDGALSPRAYATALGVSVDTALLDLRELVDRGLVRAEGTTKDRRYVLAGGDRSADDSPKQRRDSPKAGGQPPAFGEST